MRKAFLIPVMAVAFLLGTVTIGLVAAQDANLSPALIDNLIERFDLDQGEVQSVVDETRNERQAAMQTRYESWLDEEVTAGNLNADQKQLILDKQTQMRTEMEQKHAEMQEWSEENGIDLSYLHGGHFRGGFHGMGKILHRGFEPIE